MIKNITPSGVAVYGNKVMIFYYEKEASCILIENKDVSKTFTGFFNDIWKVSKK